MVDSTKGAVIKAYKSVIHLNNAVTFIYSYSITQLFLHVIGHIQTMLYKSTVKIEMHCTYLFDLLALQ